MKKIILIITLIYLTAVFSACSSSETATYNAGNNENWKINVIHSTSVTDNFKVVINDSTVIDKNANVMTGKLEEKGRYREKVVKLVVTFTKGMYKAGGEFEAFVYVENKLAAKFKF